MEVNYPQAAPIQQIRTDLEKVTGERFRLLTFLWQPETLNSYSPEGG